MLHCLVFCLSLCRTVLRTRTAQERLRQDYRYYILHNSQHKTRLAKSEEARRSVRTEHAAQASQTRVRFLLRQDEAIHPRYAPQGQHGSDSYFFISHCFFFSQLRFQLRTSHRQLLPKNWHPPQAPSGAELASPKDAEPVSTTSSPRLIGASALNWCLLWISYVSCTTHARLAWTGKWSARPVV